MVRAAATVTAVRPTAVASATAVRWSAAVITAAAPASAVETAASATTAVEATAVEATAASTAAMTATTTLRKCSGRAKQRQRSEHCENNLETSGPNHVCNLHPTTSPTMRAAGTPKPFYTNWIRLEHGWLQLG